MSTEKIISKHTGIFIRNGAAFQIHRGSQKPSKFSYMTQQITRKYIMIWWEQWELTHGNSLFTPCMEKLSGTLMELNCSSQNGD